MNPLEMLRHHVSGAIDRGEKQAITEIAPSRNAGQLAMAVINTGDSYTHRVAISRIYPYATRLARWEDMAREESRRAHYGGLLFTRADFKEAAVEIDAYMVPHIKEL